MDSRIPIALTVALVLLAVGGFYFALGPRSADVVVSPPPPVASAPAPVERAAPAQTPVQPAPAQPAPPAPAASSAAVPVPPAAPTAATPASIEAEIANSENADLQALLKANFREEYDQLMLLAAKRRNEGMSSEQFGQELFSR